MSKGALGATRIHRLLVWVVMAGMAAGLSACASQPLSGMFGSSGSQQISGRVSEPVAFATIIGAPANVADKLTAQIKAEAARQNVTVAEASGEKPTYTVRGYLAASPEANQSKIAYIWDVTDATGNRVHRIAGEELVAAKPGSSPWAGVDQAAIDKIATKTANDLAAWLPKEQAPQPVAVRQPRSGPSEGPADRAATGEVLTFVPAVSGAPGDGQKSLTLAIKKQLFKNGIKITSTPGNATHTVKGIVEMGKPEGGKQAISIQWQVLDPAGRRLGTVSQNNTIAQGALDGEWGSVADAAANSATDGILKLLPRPRS